MLTSSPACHHNPRDYPRRPKTPVVPKSCGYAVIVAMVSMLAGCISIMGIDDPADPLFVLGRVVHGFGAAMLLLGWGTRTSSISPSLSSLSITGAFALYGILITVLEGGVSCCNGRHSRSFAIICGGLLLLPNRVHDLRWQLETHNGQTPNKSSMGCSLFTSVMQHRVRSNRSGRCPFTGGLSALHVPTR